MKKLLSIVALVILAAFLVTGSFQTSGKFVDKHEATAVGYKDIEAPDWVPPAGPVNP